MGAAGQILGSGKYSDEHVLAGLESEDEFPVNSR